MTSETGRETAADTFVGATLDGRYRIAGLIGRGGMASVYRADDLVLGRRVAVKVFGATAEGIDDDDRRRSETALLASLTHPALVTLYDAAKDEATNREFLVMELVEGRDLREVLRNGPIAPADAAPVLAELAEGLHVIHSRGIVHRDVKPANVLLATAHLPTRRWNAKLADFGIARLLDESRLTSTGHIIGTPGYLSPEQVRGDQVGSAADVYGLGLLMIEALTGRQVYPGPAIESASARLVRDPEIPASLGPGWHELLAAMTARDPAARPTALDVAVTAHTLAAEARSAHGAHAAAAPDRDAAAQARDDHTLVHDARGLDGDLDARRLDDGAADADTRIVAVPSATAADASAAPGAVHEQPVDATLVLPAPPTEATRLLPSTAAPSPGATAQSTDAASLAAPAAGGVGDTRRADRARVPRWLLPVGLAGAAVIAGAFLLPTITGSTGAETPPSVTPLPSVPGDLGVHLGELEEAVTP
jgi:hypothetical protein